MSTMTVEPMTYSLGKLYDFLAAAFPNLRTKKGILDVPALAVTLELSQEAVYKSFRKDTLSRNIAKRIVERSEGRATLTDLLQFVFI